MTGRPTGDDAVSLDTSVPHIARVYDYWPCGKDNFAADRAVASRSSPRSRKSGSASARSGRSWAVRCTTLATEAGIRHFLDIGTGLPSANNTHEVAQRVAPQSRVVYVDNDPIVLGHARALLSSSPEGATAYIDADLRATAAIVERAAGVLDFGQPVAVPGRGPLAG
ncbi:MAG TPA: SAM-dependent methyltransferase [Trebonia sp.]|nr:SAM-dependent methyltransferase [Trebonia sp.]